MSQTENWVLLAQRINELNEALGNLTKGIDHFNTFLETARDTLHEHILPKEG